MKPQYLICSLSTKDKLTVVQNVDAGELKQIELKLVLAQKLVDEQTEWGVNNPVVTTKIHNWKQKFDERLLSWDKLITEQIQIFGENPRVYINIYKDTIVIPYTKILQ